MFGDFYSPFVGKEKLKTYYLAISLRCCNLIIQFGFWVVEMVEVWEVGMVVKKTKFE